MASQLRFTPKIRSLIGQDYLARPDVGRLSRKQSAELAFLVSDSSPVPEGVSRARAIGTLCKGAPPTVAIPVAAALVVDNKASRTDRIAAVRGLGMIATPEAERVLLQSLRTRNTRVLQTVLATLGEFAGPDAGKRLARMNPPDDIPTYRQWVLASTLIAYRNDKAGAGLPESLYVRRRAGSASKMLQLAASTRTKNATTKALGKFRGPTYGIRFGERSHRLTCDANRWEILLAKELGAPTTQLERLFEQPRVAGILAQWTPDREALQSRMILLTQPTGDRVRIDIARPNGEALYAGEIIRRRNVLAFRISDTAHIGVAPVNIDGTVDSKGIKLTRAISFRERINVRTTQSAI